jgi:murein DD-endopeptidase MepM/ murein hydrolase activator NlpD
LFWPYVIVEPKRKTVDLSDSFLPIKRILKKINWKKSIPLFAVSAIAIFTIAYLVLNREIGKNLTASAKPEIPANMGAFPITVPTLKYGFALDTFQMLKREIRPGQFLADILLAQQVDYPSIEKIVQNADGIFDVRQLRAGKNYVILTKDSTQRADYFIYEPSPYSYYVMHLKDDFKVEKHEKEVEKRIQTAGGVIESSLWNAMANSGASWELIAEMEDALQWSIDFHYVQKGDQFKLVFEEDYIEGEPVGVGAVHAAYYNTGGKEYHAVYFEETEHAGFYDLEGRPMKKSFLKSPVKYSRISSHFNLNRFHPILKRRRPHLGTDYAAPYGTPISAVGDGVVIQASYTNGNGNFVKIKHDDVYQTQYLHMQKFAAGIAPGAHVRQGDVIGYVGATGLATGPHVCFRFWMNGKQINHLSLNFPPPEPLPEADLPRFQQLRDQYLKMLNEIETKYVEEPQIEEEQAITQQISTTAEEEVNPS